MTIKGGTLVSASGESRGDVLIDEGRIVAVGDVESSGDVVDASTLLVLPGMVDTHVHLMDPGETEREDFPSGTRAAAARGITTIVEHTHSHPIRSREDLLDKQHHLKSRANVDYGLAAHVWPDRIDQIATLSDAGVSFFKIFTCDTHGVPGLDRDRLREALEAVAGSDGRCLIHNEDERLTSKAEKRLRAAKRIDPALLGEWRSREAELMAVTASSEIVLETGAVATFAHVSTPDVLDVIDAYRDLGADIAAEACPQYFALNEDEVEEHGALRKFTPPARIRSERERTAMWAAVRQGRFSHFATDHAPSTIPQKTTGSFWEAPFGLPGLDTTLPFLIDAALNGHMTMSELVRLYATAPARRYLLPKGVISQGQDADIVLVDPAGSWTVGDADIISKAGWSPYAGRTFRGRIVATYLRGEEIARDGACHDERTGRFVTPIR
jgi:dihydroorotase (multifunctional complex type)